MCAIYLERVTKTCQVTLDAIVIDAADQHQVKLEHQKINDWMLTTHGLTFQQFSSLMVKHKIEKDPAIIKQVQELRAKVKEEAMQKNKPSPLPEED